MRCDKCGSMYEQGAFCSQCGAKLTQEPYQNYYEQNNNANMPVHADDPSTSNILVWGILGLAFACTFFLSFLGIIFSSKAKRLFNEYRGPMSGKAKTGFILARIGFIVGIVFTALFATYIIALLALLAK